MIVPVSESNKKDWAQLCHALWPEMDEAEALEELEGLPHEFLYYEGEEAVGFFSLDLRHDYVEGTEQSPVGYLEGIYVKASHRKRGIATAMVAYAKEWVKAKGCLEFASDCELTNEESRLFHLKMGFKEANRIICFAMTL